MTYDPSKFRAPQYGNRSRGRNMHPGKIKRSGKGKRQGQKSVNWRRNTNGVASEQMQEHFSRDVVLALREAFKH